VICERINTDVGSPVERLFRYRREFLIRNLTVGAGAAGLATVGGEVEADPGMADDAAILNFALNLEYLVAEYYTLAVSGVGIEQWGVNTSGATGPPGGLIVKDDPRVRFATPGIVAYANEAAADERAHVQFLRKALDGGMVPSVARPAIDLLDSFREVAALAGLGAGFDPFADEDAFLIGAFLFEDVGVAAYHGATRRLKNRAPLDAAAGILSVEAYHAGEVRALMATRGLFDEAARITAFRESSRGGTWDRSPGDGERSTNPVLETLYLRREGGGGFFPEGLNGAIR